MHVEAHHSGGVRSVRSRQDAFASGQGAQFLDWKNHSRKSADVAEKHHTGAFRDGIVEKIEYLRGIFNRSRKRNFFNDNSVTLGTKLPGHLAAGMLLVGHEYLVARLHVHPVRDVTVGFGGV